VEILSVLTYGPILLTFAEGFITYQGGLFKIIQQSLLQRRDRMLKDKTIGFIGGGNMAEALIKGLLSGGVPATGLSVAEPDAQRRAFLAERYGVSCIEDNSAVASGSDVIVLAVKPQVAGAVLRGISGAVAAEKLLISIMAGVKTATIEAAFPEKVRVVRVMPNTPALVLDGASAISPGAHATHEDISLTRRIFELVGKAWQVEEKLMDAVTGLSGSGPAYVLTFIEALSDAGVKNGLPRDIATGLAAQTVFGTAKLLLETHEHPALLRDKVTSPGGTTIAGLHALEQEGFRGTVIDAVDAATARSKELGAK
jgi:pyrroline-5-carboxylate reductase